jgi:class 3 adenylate cyclase
VRRLVSVLFADLVGFTTLSEHRDPEQVRELLSAYFERYGGTVENFIGTPRAGPRRRAPLTAICNTPFAEKTSASSIGPPNRVEALGHDAAVGAEQQRGHESGQSCGRRA